jgi:small-conductance mechanosensitive channel/CRP-like cAMP-binding protein
MGELSQAVSPGNGLAIAGGGMLVTALLWLMLRAQPLRVRARRLGLAFGLLLAYAALDSVLAFVPRGHAAQRYGGLLSLFVLLLAFGRLLSVLLLDWFMGRRLRHEAPRIVREVAEGTLFVVASLIAMRASGVDATSILATSALLTAIIGLSLQDTLGNLFAGLALQAQHTFAVGEWIQLDLEGRHLGEVVETNWRATRVRTIEHAELTIPNAQLARSPILNYSRPARAVRRSIIVSVPYEVPCARVHTVVLNSLAQVPGVLAEPEASVITQGFSDAGVQYAVHYFIDDFERREQLDGSVRDRVWHALSRAGIRLSATAPAPATTGTSALDERVRAVRTIDFLRDLPEQAIEALAQGARSEHYEPGEIVVRQGDRGDELYLCRAGELVVMHAPVGSEPKEIAHLKVGGMFGEFAQMSGEPRSATVQAITLCELVVIGKEVFAKVLGDNPSLAELISQRMAQRQAALDELGRQASLEEQRNSVTLHQGRFLARIKDFFALS